MSEHQEQAEEETPGKKLPTKAIDWHRHWPIIASLATWIGTLAVGLYEFGRLREKLDAIEITRIELKATVEKAEEQIVRMRNLKAPQGDRGDKGEKGDQGQKGDQGLKGEVGQRGDKGDKGDQGKKGDPGPKGDPGNKGDKGDPGEDGRNGVNGPVGCIVAWPVNGQIPAGWRICNGDAVALSDCADAVANLLGDTYGTAGEGVVKLPDFRGYFLRGHGGADPDRERRFGVPQADELRSHSHGTNGLGHRGVREGDQHEGSAVSTGADRDVKPWSLDASGGPETRPVNYAIHWIIRIK